MQLKGEPAAVLVGGAGTSTVTDAFLNVLERGGGRGKGECGRGMVSMEGEEQKGWGILQLQERGGRGGKGRER